MTKRHGRRRVSWLTLFLPCVIATTPAPKLSLNHDNLKFLSENKDLIDRLGRITAHTQNNPDFCEESTAMLDFLALSAPPLFDLSSNFNNVYVSVQSMLNGSYRNVNVWLEDMALDLYFYDMVFTDNGLYNIGDQYFGHTGEYTEGIVNQHQLLLDFWDIPVLKYPLLLTGAHSEAMQGYMDLAIESWLHFEQYMLEYSVTADALLQASTSARAAIEDEIPDQYANSALTMNALYVPAYLDDPNIENKSVIVLGDGMFDFVEHMGAGEVGCFVVHAHEFSHFVQFLLDFEAAGFDIDQYNNNYMFTTEETRRAELEADAMAAYFLAHKEGNDLDVNLLVSTSELVYHFGDCYLADVDHHGSPKQRECAIRWGADTGMDLTGEPLSPQEFRNRFDKNLDSILALDPTACSLTEGESNDEEPATIPTTSQNDDSDEEDFFGKLLGFACTLLPPFLQNIFNCDD